MYTSQHVYKQLYSRVKPITNSNLNAFLIGVANKKQEETF